MRADGGAAAFDAADVFDLVFCAGGLVAAVGAAAADACCLALSLRVDARRVVDGLCPAGTLGAGGAGIAAGTLGAS